MVNHNMSSSYKITGTEIILRLRPYGVLWSVMWYILVGANVLVGHCASLLTFRRLMSNIVVVPHR